jgi:hypothetical protein
VRRGGVAVDGHGFCHFIVPPNVFPIFKGNLILGHYSMKEMACQPIWLGQKYRKYRS